MVATRTIGEARLHSLSVSCTDRSLEQVKAIFPDVDPLDIEHALRNQNCAPCAADEYRWCFNALLIELPGSLILVDTGFGFSTGGAGCPLKELLSEAGFTASDIGIVVITHAHSDHIGGLLDRGAAAFPRANLVISADEYKLPSAGAAEAFTDAEAVGKTRDSFAPYRDRMTFVSGNAAIANSGFHVVTTLPIPGHTPGHMGLEISTPVERFWILADTLHTSFQLVHPDWSPLFDHAPDTAREMRLQLLDRAAEEGIPVHFYHLPFPGWGFVRRPSPHNSRTFLFEPE